MDRNDLIQGMDVRAARALREREQGQLLVTAVVKAVGYASADVQLDGSGKFARGVLILEGMELAVGDRVLLARTTRQRFIIVGAASARTVPRAATPSTYTGPYLIGLQDNAGADMDPDPSDLRIQFTDDGVINADLSGYTMALSIAQGQIDHGSIGGLADDDHIQYAALAQAETIVASWEFQADPQINANLDFLGSRTVTTDSTNSLVLAPGGYLVLNPTGNDVLPGSHRDIELGDATTWYKSAYIDMLYAGTIKTVVFETDVIGVFNGSFMIAKSSSSLAIAKTFAATPTAGQTFFANETGRFLVGDFLRLKDDSADIWLEVTSVASDPEIEVTAKDDVGDRIFAAGTPVVNYGASGQGMLMFSALDISAGSHALNAPGMSVFDHAGVPWSATVEHVRLGNLNGWGGFVADKWGIGLGRYAANYPNFYVNASDGVMKMRIHSTDYLKFDYNAGSPLAQIVGDLEVSGGSIIAGSGSVTIDDDGIILPSHTGAAYSATKSIQFKVGATEYAHLGSFYHSPGGNDYHQVELEAVAIAAKDTHVVILAGKTASYASSVVLNTPGIEFTLHHTAAGDIYALVGPTDGETAALLYVNETSNVNMTSGITVNQGAYDDEAFTLKSSDVAHEITNATETDTYLVLKKYSASLGGARFEGYTEGTVAASLQGIGTTANTTKGTGGLGYVIVEAYEKSGAGIGNATADANLFSVHTYRDGGYVAVMLVDEDGDIYYDGSTSAYDEYDDALMAGDLGRVMAGQYERVIGHNRAALEAAGVIGPADEEGRFMVSTKRATALMLGALGQLWERCGRYEQALLALGASPVLLEH